MSQLLEQTYKGFYGDGDFHDGVNLTLCVNVINHSKRYCDYLISQDDELDGTIMDLKTESAANALILFKISKLTWTHFLV